MSSLVLRTVIPEPDIVFVCLYCSCFVWYCWLSVLCLNFLRIKLILYFYIYLFAETSLYTVN